MAQGCWPVAAFLLEPDACHVGCICFSLDCSVCHAAVGSQAGQLCRMAGRLAQAPHLHAAEQDMCGVQSEGAQDAEN